MWKERIQGVIFLGCLISVPAVTGLWSCVSDQDCSSLSGSVCSGGCVCPAGKQPVLGGTLCFDVAPYISSPCVEDHQCSRLAVAFQCRYNNASDDTGNCFCQPGHHYYLGRCWSTAGFGEQCSRSEECLATIRDPFSLSCDGGTCQCSSGYYERQRGECRKMAQAVGERCVLDEDCQFEGGACDLTRLVCYNQITGSDNLVYELILPSIAANVTKKTTTGLRQHGIACDMNSPCPEPFECSTFGCVCPIGYYGGEDGSACFAELGSPSTEEQCVGLLAEVRDGVCTCPPNFFFEENMRDCVRVTRRINESCVNDNNCHTFGASALCGAPQDPWELRSCECDPEFSVWDANRQLCRLFAGIGEACDVDSDCMAGDLEIQCRLNEDGQRTCACPDGYFISDGLCLTTGLELGDACQASEECTETANTICEGGRCSCDTSEYQELDGVCAPIIGGACVQDIDCVIENTRCTNSSEGFICQCRENFVEHNDGCYPSLASLESFCNVTSQCHQIMGEASDCVNNQCSCRTGYHFRDSGCWPVTGLFETCSRSSQCFLYQDSERVVCRNSLCQCQFEYPYNERLHTCTSSASKAMVSIFLLSAVRLALTRVVL